MNTAVDRNTLINNIDSLNNQQYIVMNEVINDMELIEAISDLINIYTICYRLSESEREVIINEIWVLTNKWIEIIGSIKYIPGLINELSEYIKTKLWNSDIECELLSKLFVKTYLIKRGSELSTDEITEYRDLVFRLLMKLGYTGSSEFINSLIKTLDPENLITIAVLSIILSTNIDHGFLD